MSAIIGIDLGTSNSVVAWEDELGKMNVIADRDDVRIHPSVVSFVEGKLVGGVLAGTAAKPRKILDPRNTVYSFKRLMGQTESSVAVRQLRARVPYEIEAGPDDTPLVRTCSGRFSAVELSAIMLGHVRQLATTHVGRQIKHAVITVPASFNDAQRSATASAGAIAGLEVVRVLNEPTAAALAYGASRRLHEIIAVYDFGGGTFDLTVLKLEDQVYQVLGTAGDSFLGGDDIDDRLVGWMLRKVIDTHRVDLREDLVAMMKLRDAAEQLKIGLSTKPTVSLTLPELAYDKRKRPLAVTFEIARGELEAMIVDLVDRTMSVTRDALAVAQVKAERISDVILVGGTTRIPYVRTGVTTFFAKAVRTDVSPQDAVAIGAALQAGSLEQRMMRDPSQPLQVQFDTREPVAASPLARGSTPIPLDPDIKLELDDFGTYLTPPPPPMPLDAQFSSGDVMPGFDIDLEPTPPPSAPPLPPPSRPRGRVVIDVTPQSLGVGTLAGYCEILIRNSSPLPTQIKRPFVTVRDNQESVRIVVCQGEARRIEENIVLGDVVLHDLPRRPRGSVIEVEFTLDSSGMLQVTARDAETGQAREVTLDLVGRMDAQEIAAARERIESLTS